MTLIRNRGRIDYSSCIESMQALTDTRDEQTADEIWLVEHPPVYTLGLNGDRAHVLDPGDIPVVQTDRGGQVTYHGPGQLVVYTLLDLRRAGIGIRALVSALEDAVVDLAAGYGIDAAARPDAPGVYVDGAKLASVGLRVRRHCSYHGLALNVSMDTRPFARINPCGFAGLRVTQLDELGAPTDIDAIGLSLVERLVPALGLDSPTFIDASA